MNSHLMFVCAMLAKTDVPPWALQAGGAALGLIFLILALRAGSRKRLIDNVPTSKTAGVFIGLVELNGTAESEKPLRSFLAGAPCVWYRWNVEEHWSKVVTETYKDSQGNTQTRKRTESGWTTVAKGEEGSVFYLRDDLGVIRVNPKWAKIEPEGIFSRECTPLDPMYYGRGPVEAVMHSDHQRRFTEQALPLHAPLYVMGASRLREDVVAPEIAQAPSAPIFLISTRTEKQISRGLAAQFWIIGILAMLFAAAGWVAADKLQGLPLDRRAMIYVAAGLAAVGAWILGWVWMVYNSMADLRQRVLQGWANVDVQLKRRADLIPNLVSLVKGMRDYEAAVQQQVAQLRSQAEATRPGAPGPDPESCRKAVLAIQEAYPELKANQSFLRLQAELTDTEQRIALAREYFNTIAAHYNTRLQVVPDHFVCAMAHLRPQPLLGAADFEREAVRVDLAE